MSVFTLEQLADMAGEDEGFDVGQKKAFVDPFQLKVAYPIEILDQKVTATKNGYTQLELAVGIVQGDGEVKGAGRRWVMLPDFSADIKATQDPEKIKALTETFGKSLWDLLRAVDPSTFQVFDRAEKNGRKWTFFDADGNEMTPAEKTTREKMIGKAITGAAKAIVAGNLSVVGKRLYLVRNPSAKNPQKIWDNWFSTQPTKYAMAEV